jgi:hypothetical protein
VFISGLKVEFILVVPMLVEAFFRSHPESPLTPWENRLRVPIRAGEQLFAAAHAELLADEAGQSAQVP